MAAFNNTRAEATAKNHCTSEVNEARPENTIAESTTTESTLAASTTSPNTTSGSFSPASTSPASTISEHFRPNHVSINDQTSNPQRINVKRKATNAQSDLEANIEDERKLLQEERTRVTHELHNQQLLVRHVKLRERILRSEEAAFDFNSGSNLGLLNYTESAVRSTLLRAPTEEEGEAARCKRSIGFRQRVFEKVEVGGNTPPK